MNMYTKVVDTLTTDAVRAEYVQKRLGEIQVIDTYAAKRVRDRLEALILEVTTSTLDPLGDWPRSKGFEVQPRPLQGQLPDRTRVTLQLIESRFREVFRALADDVCGVLSEAPDEAQAIESFQKRLERWQSFLQKHGSKGLNPEAQCGLYGELHVFRDTILPVAGPANTVRAWRGCKKAHQDFQFPHMALEVKTTRAVIVDKISVSSIRQLDSEGLAPLFLTVVHVDANETNGGTLPETVASLREVLGDDARDLLDEGLVEVGYLDEHEHLYANTRYQCLKVFHFAVESGFPRLTLDQIPDGVKGVRYQISIDACGPFRVDGDHVHRSLRLDAGNAGRS